MGTHKRGAGGRFVDDYPRNLPTWRCGKCGEVKPRSHFSKIRKNSSGLDYSCRICRAIIWRAWYKKNEKKYARHKAKFYYEDLYGHRYISLRYVSKRKGWKFSISKEAFVRWCEETAKRCVYCDLEDLRLDDQVSGKTYRMFSIDRKDNSLPYKLDNMCFACLTCNFKKGNYFTYAEWREIAQKYVKPKWLSRRHPGAV